MASKLKGVTIELTPKQQDRLRKLTGQDHSKIRVEKRPSGRAQLSAKSAPSAPRFGRPGGGYTMVA